MFNFPSFGRGLQIYIDMEDIRTLLDEYKSLAGNTDAKSEERKNEIIAKLETMDKDAVAEVAKPFLEENVTRLEGEVKALRSQIDAEDYKLLPISYIAKTYFNKSAAWLCSVSMDIRFVERFIRSTRSRKASLTRRSKI